MEQDKRTPEERYPHLMAYIHDRNTLPAPGGWFRTLCEDEAAARQGGFADVAADLDRAQADYAAQQAALGRNQYPYNAYMGGFLGLPLKANPEPGHGYYMAVRVRTSFWLGNAMREVAALIAAGRPLRIVTARSKADGKPVRFATFAGPDQIRIVGNTVEASNGKRKATLRSGSSEETALVAVAKAMANGLAYGEKAGGVSPPA